MESRVDRFTSRFFWGGYAVFLLASIPHIAAYFRHFDPVETNWLANGFWWLIAYAIAIVIDLSDVLVSIAVIKAMKKSAGFGDVFGYWAFIVFIMALSWFVNWQYNVVYGTTSFAAADAKSIFGLSVGTVNPIIGSAFQMLLLVYTAMAHKFADKPGTSTPVKSLETLRAEARESAERASLERQISEARTSAKIGLIQRARVTMLGSEQTASKVTTNDDESSSLELTHETQIEDAVVSQSVDNEMVFPPVEYETDASTDEPFIDDITAYLTRQEKDTGDIVAVSTDHETEPRAKVTRKLSTKTSTAKGRENARTKALRIARKHPGIGPTELAQKAQITRQYASKILSELSA